MEGIERVERGRGKARRLGDVGLSGRGGRRARETRELIFFIFAYLVVGWNRMHKDDSLVDISGKCDDVMLYTRASLIYLCQYPR